MNVRIWRPTAILIRLIRRFAGSAVGRAGRAAGVTMARAHSSLVNSVEVCLGGADVGVSEPERDHGGVHADLRPYELLEPILPSQLGIRWRCRRGAEVAAGSAVEAVRSFPVP